jgi:restriction system protein
MPIPTYQEVMLPFLRQLGDGQILQISSLMAQLTEVFALTEEERQQMLPSGKTTTFRSRVGWAKTYLKMSGLIENEGRGSYRITARGREVLNEPPAMIDNLYLRRFPEFVQWYDASRNQGGSEERQPAAANNTDIDEKTPDEALFDSYSQIRRNLEAEVLEIVKAASPLFFEKLVVDLLVRMGYGGNFQEAASRLTRRSGDEGIDGIINEDRLGLDVIYVQAKRWEGTVSRPEIQKFAGALQGKRAKKGVFITTSDFSREAKDYADFIDTKIVLINGHELAGLMIDFNVGVSIDRIFELKKVDSDYFVEE